MDLRSFLERLRDARELIDIRQPVSLDYEAGAICRQLADANGPAAMLHKVGEGKAPLVVNVFGTRRRVAMALGSSEEELLGHVAKKLKTRVPTEPHKGGAARCQEVVLTGRDVDILKWPFPLWNTGDGGRYITAGNIISRHPEFGWNIAYHRAQLYSETELGICMAPEHHLRYLADESRGKHRVEAAIVIGVRPSVGIAAGSDFPIGDYELGVAGALEGAPIRTVRCKTIDVEVPEDNEIVLEGYFPGIVRTLSLATAAVMPRLKYVIVVDDDIDLYNFSDVMWAVATRCDPKADMAVIGGTMTSWLDPSSGGLTGKVLFDATKKAGFGGHIPGYPDEAMARARQLIEGATRR